MAGQRDVEVRRRTLPAQLPFARVPRAMSPTPSKYETATSRPGDHGNIPITPYIVQNPTLQHRATRRQTKGATLGRKNQTVLMRRGDKTRTRGTKLRGAATRSE